MNFNFKEQINKYEAQYGTGGKFKIKEGKNKVRVISEAVLSVSEYKGQETRKFACYVINRENNKIELFFAPKRIIGEIANLQMSDEYSFESIPMPYDITIIAEGAGTKEVKYSVQPSRENTPLTEKELEEISKLTPISEVLEKIKNKKSEVIGSEEEIPVGDMPF